MTKTVMAECAAIARGFNILFNILKVFGFVQEKSHQIMEITDKGESMRLKGRIGDVIQDPLVNL